MNWTVDIVSPTHHIHSTECTETSDQAVQIALHRCADYAFELLEENIQDEAMYCLFMWDIADRSLNIVITDESKSTDGKHLVKMTFASLPVKDEVALPEWLDSVKYWITDYLTTCPAFLAFSLLAGFVRLDSRISTERKPIELM